MPERTVCGCTHGDLLDPVAGFVRVVDAPLTHVSCGVLVANHCEVPRLLVLLGADCGLVRLVQQVHQVHQIHGLIA